MKKRPVSMQGELFGTSDVLELKNRIRELDRRMARAMKAEDYTLAKTLTEQQETLIQQLVQLGDSNPKEP